ncbi:MAG: hypothetical protein Q8O30_07195 [Candidatus Omnitrophota bacterium]|nr:hypothetical protein [Candidatus Omnitrophota bacterium]
MVPSIWERINYCFDAYELCPLFCNSQGEDKLNTVNGHYEMAI